MHLFILLPILLGATAVLLPSPNGPYSVAMSTMSLEDRARVDPYAPPESPHLRKVLLSLFFPTNSTTTPCEQRPTSYMTPAVAADYDLLAASLGLPNNTFASFEMNTCQPTVRRERSCPAGKISSFPLVLFSPGFGQSRLLYGAMARSLASQGYIVITVDHPYDASVVEFPDGTIVRGANISTDDDAALEQVVMVRTTDISFILDQLQRTSTFNQTFKAHRVAINLKQIAMFGHSMGGAAAATTMLNDRRIMGGINMDGKFFNPALEMGLQKPFLLMGRPGHSGEDETWPAMWQKLRGHRVEMSIDGTVHGSFTDFPVLIDSLNLPEFIRRQADSLVGRITGQRRDSTLMAVLPSFFDMVFGKSIPDLLQRGSADIPELKIVAADLK